MSVTPTPTSPKNIHDPNIDEIQALEFNSKRLAGVGSLACYSLGILGIILCPFLAVIGGGVGIVLLGCSLYKKHCYSKFVKENFENENRELPKQVLATEKLSTEIFKSFAIPGYGFFS